MESDKKYIGGWWMWIITLIMVSMIVVWFLNAIGLIGKTIVERKVFENSYQYSEARKSEIALFTAQLAEINARLNDTTISKSHRAELEGQRSALNIQLNVARSK